MNDAPADQYSSEQREVLLKLSRDSIAYGLDKGLALPLNPEDFPESLRVQRASFVTLHLDDELQGCIGTLKSWQPLVIGVARHAFAAAFEDPRGRILSASDIPRLLIHISVLSEPEALTFSSEEDLIRQLRPGIDGVIIEEHGRSGTLLPSVWESIPEPRAFLGHVKLKAGLPQDYWSPTLQVRRYTTESFGREH